MPSEKVFSLDFVLWSHSAGKLTIHSVPYSWIVLTEYSSKSTLPFAGLYHFQNCQVRVFHNFVPSLNQNERCLKNSLHRRSLNPGPLGHESSVLTTSTRLLAYHQRKYLQQYFWKGSQMGPINFCILKQFGTSKL